MGSSGYNFSNRSARTKVYQSQSFEQTFEQQAKRCIHEKMDPKVALIRESRDSETHPNSLPIIIGLDITGSMDYIPKQLITNGLPNLVSSLQEKGIHDAAILFMGIGDSRANDRGPLQVGQFESGDAELDMDLTRTWIEGGGGGNGGESYGWAWWFAAKRCVTDAWEKRKQKGFIFTIGDDNCHDILRREFMEVLGITHETVTKEQLYKLATERWNVYHINMEERNVSGDDFKTFIGENLIQVKNHEDIPVVIARIISGHTAGVSVTPVHEAEESDEQGYPGMKHDVKITL